MTTVEDVCQTLLTFAAHSPILKGTVRSFIQSLEVPSRSVGATPTAPAGADSICAELASLIGVPVPVCAQVTSFIESSSAASAIFWDAVELQISELSGHPVDGFGLLIEPASREHALSTIGPVTLQTTDFLYAAQRAMRAELSQRGSAGLQTAASIRCAFIHNPDQFYARQPPDIVRGAKKRREELEQELARITARVTENAQRMNELQQRR